MNTLSEFQINLIRGDIRQNGIELIDLEDDLLDHVCSAIELEAPSSASFEDVYQRIKKEIFPEGYRQIQETTTQLITQKYTTMKKAMNTFAILGSSMILIGSIMKLLHLALANQILILGAASLVAIYLPLLLVYSLKQTDILIGKARNISGYLGANLMIIGIVFQVMHWQWGKELLAIGFIIFLLIFIPLFFKSLGKDAMMKIQPTTATVLLITIVCSLFAFSIKRPSSAYINSLLSVNENIQQTYELKFNRLLTKRTSPDALSSSADQALKYIDGLKKYLIKTVDRKNNSGELKSYNMNTIDKKLDDIMITNSGNHDYNGKTLETLLNGFLNELHKTNPELNTLILATKEGQSWTEAHFMQNPIYSIHSTLSNFQLEIVDLELEARN